MKVVFSCLDCKLIANKVPVCLSIQSFEVLRVVGIYRVWMPFFFMQSVFALTDEKNN
jgi:hypothetical protein